MVSHSLIRDRSEAHSHAFSGGSGTSTETESLAICQFCGGVLSTAFFAASCTLSTCWAYLPCVFWSTPSPALSIAVSTAPLFFDMRSLTLSRNPMGLPYRCVHRRRRSPRNLPCTHQITSI